MLFRYSLWEDGSASNIDRLTTQPGNTIDGFYLHSEQALGCWVISSRTHASEWNSINAISALGGVVYVEFRLFLVFIRMCNGSGFLILYTYYYMLLYLEISLRVR
jgi:hypothetical protein